MTRKNLLFVILVAALSLLTTTHVYATPVAIPLEVGYENPNENQDDPHKNPISIPQVSIEVYTLYFNTPCDGYVLHLVDENDNVAYSTVIPVGATSLILPPYLFGIYELQLLPSNCNYYFYGTIDL